MVGRIMIFFEIGDGEGWTSIDVVMGAVFCIFGILKIILPFKQSFCKWPAITYHHSEFICAFWTLFFWYTSEKHMFFLGCWYFFWWVFILTDDTRNHKESSWALDFWGDAWKVKSPMFVGSDLYIYITRWWFQICFISTPTWGRFPFWRSYFSIGFETTN